MKKSIKNLVAIIIIFLLSCFLFSSIEVKGISNDENINLQSYTTDELIDLIIENELDYIDLFLVNI